MTYQPLGGSDAFPANPDEIRAYGEDVARTGALIAEQVELLRRLADGDSWVTESADAFRERAEELAGQIEKSGGRYERVGRGLKALSDTLEDLERDGQARAREAQLAESVIRANPPAVPEPGPDGGPPALTLQGEAQNARRQEAEQALADLQRQFDGLVAQAREAASATARTLSDAIDDDVKDSWWDKNAGWIKTVTQVLGAIAAVAAIVMLTVATGGTIWLVALGVALTAGVVSAILNAGLASTGNGSWWAVAIDMVGVVTLGVGGAALRALGKGFPAVQSAMASYRGSLAFSGSMNRLFGLPLRFHSWRASWSVNWLGMRSSSLASISRMSDDALRAADDAFQATLRPYPVTFSERLIDGGRSTAETVRQSREFLAQLRRVDAPPAELLEQTRNLVLLGRAGTTSTNVGSAVDLGQLGQELRALDPYDIPRSGKVIADVISRLL